MSIFQWFSPKQRGTVYSIWGGSRNIGEAITWILTATIVSFFGWRAGFIGAGIAGIAAGIILLMILKDRPRTYGLPDPASAYGEESEAVKSSDPKETRRAQLFVLKQPTVWIIAQLALLCISHATQSVHGRCFICKAQRLFTD